MTCCGPQSTGKLDNLMIFPDTEAYDSGGKKHFYRRYWYCCFICGLKHEVFVFNFKLKFCSSAHSFSVIIINFIQQIICYSAAFQSFLYFEKFAGLQINIFFPPFVTSQHFQSWECFERSQKEKKNTTTKQQTPNHKKLKESFGNK